MNLKQQFKDFEQMKGNIAGCCKLALSRWSLPRMIQCNESQDDVISITNIFDCVSASDGVDKMFPEDFFKGNKYDAQIKEYFRSHNIDDPVAWTYVARMISDGKFDVKSSITFINTLNRYSGKNKVEEWSSLLDGLVELDFNVQTLVHRSSSGIVSKDQSEDVVKEMKTAFNSKFIDPNYAIENLSALDACSSQYDPKKYLARYTSIVQSSMTGKTWLISKIAEYVHVIYFLFRPEGNSIGYPTGQRFKVFDHFTD